MQNNFERDIILAETHGGDKRRQAGPDANAADAESFDQSVTLPRIGEPGIADGTA